MDNFGNSFLYDNSSIRDDNYGTGKADRAGKSVVKPARTAKSGKAGRVANTTGAGAMNRTGAIGNSNVSAGSKSAGNKYGLNTTGSGFKLELTDKDLLNGIIMSEVLGKPKCFRRGR